MLSCLLGILCVSLGEPPARVPRRPAPLLRFGGQKDFVLCGGRRGRCPSTPPPFTKGGRKSWGGFAFDPLPILPRKIPPPRNPAVLSCLLGGGALLQKGPLPQTPFPQNLRGKDSWKKARERLHSDCSRSPFILPILPLKVLEGWGRGGRETFCKRFPSPAKSRLLGILTDSCGGFSQETGFLRP